MRSASRVFLFGVVVVIAFGCPSSTPDAPQVFEPAATRIVSPGTSVQATLDAAAPGEIIELTNGAWNESVVIRKSVTLRAQTKHGSRLRGIDVASGVSGVAITRIHCQNGNIYIDGASNVTVTDCLVTNTPETAFSTQPRQTNGQYRNRNVRFERCNASDVGGGFSLHGYDCAFINGRIERLYESPTSDDADFARINGMNLTIANNVFYGGENTFQDAHPDGVQTFVTGGNADDYCHHVTIVGNVYDGGNIGNDTGIHQVVMFEEDIGQDRVSDVTFRNNIVIKSYNHGVRVRGFGTSGGIPRVTVVNNVFDRPDKGSISFSGSRTVNGVCRDNILSNGGGITIENGASVSQSNNPRHNFPAGIPHGGTLVQYRAFYGLKVNGAGLN